MINNYYNQENDVYAETLAADKALSDLSEEQLRDVLEQLTDHNLPDSEKCPLVRRLNAENASKDESDLVISRFCKSSSSASAANTCRNNRKSRYLQRSGSKDAECVREKTNGSNIKKVHSSQSLQDLMSSANSDCDSTAMRAIGATRSSGKQLNKANSFTMPSGSQHFCKNNNINVNKEGFSELLSSPELRTSSQLQTQQTQHSLKGTRNKSVKSRPTSYISTSSVTALCENSQNDSSVKSDDESGVSSAALSDPTISSRTVHECYATQSVYTDNHNINCDKNCSPLCNSSAPAVEHECCTQTEYIEMKDLGRRVNIIEYSSERDVNIEDQQKAFDSFIDLGLKTVSPKDVIKTGVAERVVNHNCDSDAKEFSNMSEDNKLIQFQGNEGLTKASDPTNPYQDSDLANIQHMQTTQSYKDPALRNSNNSREKKKKKTEVPVKMAEEIKGHIGFKDVEYLEAFVNSSGNESSKQLTEMNAKNGALFVSNSVKESVKKKEKGIQLTNNVSKRKNPNVSLNQSVAQNKNSVSPNIPLSTSSSSFSSDEANGVIKHSDFAQRTDSLTRETTSPVNSSSDSKDKIVLNREDSDLLDDEKLSNSTINSSFSLMTSNVSAELLYTASDSEMADKGFVTPKSKHFKRRKGLMRRIDRHRNQRSPNRSMQSSTSTTPSSSTVSATAGYERFGGMRGYESEREYTDDYRRAQNSSVCSRRKSLSSVPHSEQNSAYNSDGELSSHSMPIRNDSLNTDKSNSESRTTPSSISSTPKASYADIAKTLNLSKRSSVDAIYTTNVTIGTLSINTSVQYQDFPQLDLSLTPVTDVSTPSSPNNSKMIKALVSPPQKTVSEKKDQNSDSYSAPTSMTNTPVPQPIPQNECLFSETVKDNNTCDEKTIETSEVSLVPAVIMCDYSESVPISDIGSVTFGFFEDLSANSVQNVDKSESKTNSNESTELKAKSPIKTSPEAKSHVNNSTQVSDVGLTYIDVDKKSFNYEHIIGFIKTAWDNAKRDYQLESVYESSHKVK